MIAIDFGNLCFNVGASEQNILVVAAPKHTFSSLDDFITAALKFMESDERFCDNWTEHILDDAFSSTPPSWLF